MHRWKNILIEYFCLIEYIEYNLIEYIDNCSKTSGSLWQYYKDDPNDTMPRSGSFKYKIKITGKTPANEKAIVAKIAVPLNSSVIFGELLKCH